MTSNVIAGPAPATYIVGTTSLKSAEKNGGGRAYLARLTAGPRGSVQRRFIRAQKINDKRSALESAAVAGDVFECRRWLWDQQRQQYEGGIIWFGIQSGGEITMLTREEAFRAVGAIPIASSARPEAPDNRRLARTVPDDLICVPFNLTARALRCGEER